MIVIFFLFVIYLFGWSQRYNSSSKDSIDNHLFSTTKNIWQIEDWMKYGMSVDIESILRKSASKSVCVWEKKWKIKKIGFCSTEYPFRYQYVWNEWITSKNIHPIPFSHHFHSVFFSLSKILMFHPKSTIVSFHFI